MNKDGELGLFPNQLLMVCANPGGFFQLQAYATGKSITHAAAETAFKMYLSLTCNDMLCLAFQLRTISTTAANVPNNNNNSRNTKIKFKSELSYKAGDCHIDS